MGPGRTENSITSVPTFFLLILLVQYTTGASYHILDENQLHQLSHLSQTELSAISVGLSVCQVHPLYN